MNKFLDVDAELDFQPYELRDLISGRASIVAELDKIAPKGQLSDNALETRFNKLADRCEKLDAVIADRQKYVERRDRMQRLSGGAPGSPANPPQPGHPMRGPETEQRDLLDNIDAGKTRYSLLRALDLVSRGKALDGLEGEVNQEIESRSGKAAGGFYMPWTLPLYNLRATMPRGYEERAFNLSGGAGLIPNVLSGNMIDVLRNRMVMSQLGAVMLTGMVGTFDIPKVTGTGTAYWVGEAGDVTGSQPATTQVEFAPTTVGAYTDITRRLLKQSGWDAEQLVRNDLMKILQLELDRVGINGSGASNQPEGILQNDSLEIIEIGTDGGAATFRKIVELETAVASQNADLGSLAYLTSAQGRGALKTTRKDAGSGIMLYERDELNGYRALASQQVPANLTKGDGENLTSVLFGNFNDAVYAFWGAIDVNVDTASLSKSGGLRIVLLADAQFKLRRIESFAAIVDLDPAAVEGEGT